MKLFTLVLLALATIRTTNASSGTRIAEEFMPTILLESSEKDKSLTGDESKFVFTFRNISNPQVDEERPITPPTIIWNMDGGETKHTQLNSQNELEVICTPGTHEFQFYYNYNYLEIFSSPITIKKGFKNNYSVYFEMGQMDEVEKPVIYLYPEEELDVEVRLDIVGKPLFMYPAYTDGWKFKASPDGTLRFGDQAYNYLFWESKNYAQQFKMDRGFCVKGNDAIPFLEKQLTSAGLTSQEQADFITYWGPRLAQNEYNFVRFEFNEECDKYAALDINPTPDNIYRIYMVWHKLSHPVKVINQPIPSVNRSGFTVIEWGGQELNPLARKSYTSSIAP